MQGISSMIFTGRSPGAAQVGHVVISFLGLVAVFVCCWGELLDRLAWIVLGMPTGLFLF